MEEEGWISSFGENPRTTAAPNTTALPRLEGNSLKSRPSVGPRFLGYCSSFGSIVESFGMPLFVKVRSFLRNLFLSRRVEVDLDQEVHSHLEMLIAENIRAGLPPQDAQRAARVELAVSNR